MTEPVDAELTASKPKRILVVDDEPNIVRLIQVQLERHGHQVQTARDGIEALASIKTHRPDLVITDLMMPEMDGVELLTAIRSELNLESLPVLILGARPSDVDLNKEPEDIWNPLPPGVHMLWKPFTPQKLVAIVKKVLPGSPAKDKQ